MQPLSVLRTLACAVFALLALAACQRDHDRIVVRGEDCYTCHQADYEGAENPAHEGRFPITCGDCHSQDAWRPAAGGHPDEAFPIDVAAHAEVRCDDCHDSSRGSSAAGANTVCVDCHSGEHARALMDPLHVGVTGYPTGPAEPNFCLTCHPSGSAEGTPHPDDDFPISTGPHAPVECLDCHNPVLGTSAYGANADCVGCHTGEHDRAAMDLRHRGVVVTMYPRGDAPPNFCLVCHPTGLAPIQLHPNDRFEVEAGPHGPFACADCHDESRGANAGGANTSCVGCHEGRHERAVMDPLHSGTAGYPTGPAPENFCLTCHPDGTTAAVGHPEDRFTISGGPHAGFRCADCHDASLGVNTGGANTNCVGCHTGEHSRASVDAGHAGRAGYPTGAAAPNFCLTCHPDGTADAAGHPEAAFRVASGRHAYECAECHNAALGPNTRGQNTDCVGCHEGDHTRARMDDKHSDVRDYPGDDSRPNFCLACHPNGVND